MSPAILGLKGRSVVTPPIDLDKIKNVNDDIHVNNENDLHVENSPVTMRQSGRVHRKPAWVGENYEMLHSVPASSCSETKIESCSRLFITRPIVGRVSIFECKIIFCHVVKM